MTWGNVAVVSRIFGNPHVLFHDSWTRLVTSGMKPGDFVMSPARRMPAHRAANAIVQSFLNEPEVRHCDSICFVDDDHTFRFDTLERMRSDDRTWEYDAVGACYSARGAGRWPVIMRYSDKGTPEHPRYGVYWDWTEGDVVEVDCLGLGFTLIRRHVFEAIAHPWYEYWELPTEYTEDVVFFHKFRQAGFRCAVATGVRIGHLYDAVIVPCGDQYQAHVVDAVRAIQRAEGRSPSEADA